MRSLGLLPLISGASANKNRAGLRLLRRLGQGVCPHDATEVLSKGENTLIPFLRVAQPGGPGAVMRKQPLHTYSLHLCWGAGVRGR